MDMSTIAGRLIAWESGELAEEDFLQFFSDLITSGVIAHLQGTYQRKASDLINDRFLNQDGTIAPRGVSAIEQMKEDSE